MRLDRYLVENLGVVTRSKAANLIKMGRVSVNGQVTTKAAADVEGKQVALSADMEYASMGGYKLSKALDDFDIDVKGKTACDIGASNGGFTSVLLSKGASLVYAVDVGDCALSYELRNDKRVIVMDRTNARDLSSDKLGSKVSVTVADVSFISLKLILPSIKEITDNGGKVIALVKPQFEVGAKYLNKKGIVTDDKARKNALEDIIKYAESIGFEYNGQTIAPEYKEKNKEYLIYLTSV